LHCLFSSIFLRTSPDAALPARVCFFFQFFRCQVFRAAIRADSDITLSLHAAFPLFFFTDFADFTLTIIDS